MVEAIPKILSTLSSSAPEDAREKFSKIRETFDVPLSGAQLDYAFSMLFAEKCGILSYMREKSNSQSFGGSIVDAFKLLAYLILQNFKKWLENYIADIKNVCTSCIVRDMSSADQKEKAFEVLQAIFENGPWQKDLEVSGLIEKLLLQLQKRKKPTPKVLAKEYHLLGIIARTHPGHMLQRSHDVLRHFFDDLQYQTSETPHVSFPQIEGCINGLTEFLYSFTQSPEDSPENCEKIYSYLKKLSLAKVETGSRRTALRAALNLLAKHGCQFSTHLYQDYRHWHAYLNKWLYLGREDAKMAMAALSTFYEQVMANLQNSDNDDRPKVMQYFMKFFKDKLLSRDIRKQEQHIVIKAFGMFAGPCRLLMSEKDVLYMFLLTVQKAKEICQQKGKIETNEVKYLADYVASLSSIIVELEVVSTDHLSSFQHVIVMLIEAFPELPAPFKPLAARAVAGAFYSVASRGSSALDCLFTTVVYQGVIRTCSHPVALDVELQKEQLSNKNYQVSYKDYVMFWTNLMQLNYYKHDFPLSSRHIVINKIYDEFVSTVITLCFKLNLETKRKKGNSKQEDDVPVLDPEAALEAVVPRDFQVFINLCDLCRDVLVAEAVVHHFKRWVYQFCHSAVRHIHRNPLISGFYKLLTVALQLCCKLKFFKDYASAAEDSRKPCYLLLTKFLSDLTCRCQQYKGDLQVSCIETVLAAPVELVTKLVQQTQSVFQASFHLGHSKIALAHLALSTLERWCNLLPSAEMKPLLKVVLLDLDAYLRSLGVEEQADTDVVEIRSTVSRQSVKSFARRKNLLERPETELLKLQRQILMFLGQQDTDTNSALVDGQEIECVSWDTNNHLKYAVPFADMKVTINLDELLPRVVDLALSCSNRQTRIAACEFIHAVIMYMLGTNMVQEQSKPGHLHKLFEKLTMPLLQLGCDSDQVVYQLFNPLALQLTRWYSSHMQIRSKHTEILLHALMDGITHPTDTAVQDYSAKCLHEFVVWSIKQSSLEEKSNANISAVLKMTCSFCVHPSSVKRLGGALVFNSTYKVLREKEAVLDQHWLELLYYLVCNLALADPSGADGTDTAQQVSLALDRIARVLTEKTQLFCKPSKNRRVPPELKTGHLKDAVEWLLQQCGSLQPDCQCKCMELVCCLAPLLAEYGSAANFLQRRDVSELHAICSGSKLSATLPNGATPSQINTWLDELLASLKCYLWLIKERFLSPEHLFGAETSVRLFEALEYFVEHVSSKTVRSMVLVLHGDFEFVSVMEEEHFDQKKCSIILNLLNLASAILRSAGSMPSVSLGFFTSTSFCRLIASLTFHPLHLGFDMRNLQLLEALPKSIEDFLNAACREETVYKRMLAVQQDMYSAAVKTLLADVEMGMKSGTITELQNHLIQGLKILQKCGLLSLIGCKLVGEELISAVTSALVKTIDGGSWMVRLDPTTQIFGESVLQLCFLLGDQVEVLLQCVLDETLVQTEMSEKGPYLGDHFLSTFRSSVLDQFLCHVEKSVGQLLGGSVNDHTLNVFAQLLQYLLQSKCDSRYRCSDAMMKIVIDHWGALKQWADASSDNTVQLLGMLCDLAASLEAVVGSLREHRAIVEWVTSQIRSRQLQQLQKDRALDLLPCLTSPDEDTNEPVTSALKDFKDQYIPRRSAELPPSSLEYSSFVSAFNKILLALELSGSRILLFRVISMTAGDPNHICEDNIQSTLRYFISRLQPNNQVRALEVAYSVYTSRDYDATTRLSAALRFCRTMLQASCMESLRSFLVTHVPQLLRYVSQTWLPSNRSEADQQLVERMGAWAVFELLFCRLEQAEIEDPGSPITRAAFPRGVTTGKELLVELTKRSFGTRKENIPAVLAEDSEVRELFRRYQCAAYNALVSIISNSKRTAEDLKFYHTFLFSENRSKDQMLWSKIVDCSREITFPMDWEEIPARRKKMVAIRRSNTTAPEGGVMYLPTGTQMLFDSTLREDVTSFDFTLSVLQSRQASPLTGRESSVEVMLEMDSLNEHECMASFCGLVKHLVETKISPTPGNSPLSLPSWMEAIKKSLEDDDNPRNARLFILKLILNCESFFRPYAKFWYTPIMKALLNRCAGSSINYMFTDIVTMLLEWHDVAIPNSSDFEKQLASQILYFFMSNVESSRRDVFKHNIEVVKTIVELWKSCLEIPYQLLVNKINVRGNTDSASTEVGLQLVAVVLANGIEPWNAVGKMLFLNNLVSNFESNKSEVYLPCAEVVGMTLKMLGAGESTEINTDAAIFLHGVEEKLMKMKASNSSLTKFLLCLYGMGKHCCFVVKQFATILCFQVQKLSGSLLAKCLEMIGLWPEAVSELVATGVGDFLRSHNLDVQEAALTAVSQVVRQLNTPQLVSLMPDIVQFVSHASVTCRCKMFDVLMWVHDKYNNDPSPQGQLLFEESRTTLIRGLVDADATIQDLVYNFWNNSTRLPAATSQRLLTLMKNLYSPTTENLLTGCLAHLQLQASVLSPDYNAKVFDHPLGACRFEEYPMLVSWRAQHSTMAPLFANTLASQLHSQDPHSFDMIVRATQESLAFKPTVDTREDDDDDNDASVAIPNTFTSSFNTSTLFTLGSGSRPTSELYSTRSKLQSGGFAKPETTKSFLRRRFLKNRNDIRESFARREMNRNLQRQARQQESVRRREATVAMYRTYRIGELPDIEIPHSAIIKPLQALAKQDSSVACQVVVALFLGMSGGVEDKEGFLFEVGAVMKHILESTVQCCPPVVEMVLKIALPNTDDIQLYPEHLCTASRVSSLFSLGALVLEKMLLSKSEEAVVPTKQARTVRSPEDGLWLQLAELYSGLDEWDVVHGVFSNKLHCTEAMKEALVAESGRDWHTAQSSYREAIMQEDCNYSDYCRQAYYKCLSHLSKWEELKTHVYEDAEEDADNLWKDPWYQEKVLPWFLSSELQLKLNILGETGGYSNDWQLLQKIQSWMQDGDKKHLLKCNYSEVLAMMWLLKEDYSMANHHAMHNVNIFLASWAHVNPLALKRRAGMLLDLCRAVEMHTYLAVATINDNEVYQQRVNSLLDKWSVTLPCENDSLVVWDQRIAYRVGFAKQIEDRLNLSNMDSALLLQKLASTKLEMEMSLVDAALSQNNFHLARGYLQKTKVMVNGRDSQGLNARWKLYYSRLLYLRADQEDELSRKFHPLLDAWKELNSVFGVGVAHGPLLAKAYQLQSMLSQEMLRLAGRDASLLNSSSEPKVAELLDHLSLECNSGTDVILCKLKSYGLNCLENAIGTMNHSTQAKEIAEAYFSIAQYCRSDVVKKVGNSSELDHHVVQSILRAMKFGSRAARQLFPCVLQLPGLSTVHRQAFLSESLDVPEWMFLAWVSQILAILDTDSGPLLNEVVLRLAQSFPQAVVFPFNISCTKYNFADSEEGRQGRALVLRLKKILHGNQLVETFVEAFTYLASPRLILEYHLRILKTRLQEIPFDSKTFCEMLHVALKESFCSPREKPKLHGKLFTLQLQEFKAKLEKVTGSSGSKVNTKNTGKVLKCLIDLEGELTNKEYNSSKIISDYSPWLGEFQATKFTDEIEVPGQYVGDKRPLPHLHAKIVSFGENVMVMKSKCHPIRITINGSDAKQHKFLVKFGEDLRQDQRIEQLFRLMNEILDRDAACSHRGLRLATYNVVPLNNRVGIIEWVDNTEIIADVFKRTMTPEEISTCGQINASYGMWIHATSKTAFKTEAPYYLLAYDKYSRNETVDKFTQLVNRLPWDILRRSLESLSISPEAFFTLRHNFASSYATMCVCQWLLGVGDRHLSNCLVSMKDARCIGIDFGYSFGVATQFLPVPELFPFRLTPHIVSLMKPFELSGVYYETMVSVLRALRTNHDMLLATMEVFVQEPSLNWLESAGKQGNALSDGEKWYPRQKILLARRKLQGANPAAITVEELNSRSNNNTKFEAVARGDPAYNVRARMPSDDLSPEDQVSCLLDQATDYHILGKTWIGWQPWM